ncbi:MAG: radical SAM protein [Candidatus Dormibacteria bacterium]
MAAELRPLLSDARGEMVVAPPGWRAVGQSGSRVVDPKGWMPLPDGSTLMHLPDRPALGRHRGGGVAPIPGSHPWAVAAVLPVGYLRLLLPAHIRLPGAAVLPLYGYAATADRGGQVVVAAQRSDDFAPWTGVRPSRARMVEAVASVQRELPRSRVIAQLSVCALQHNCLTAQNTFLGRDEGALPTSAACNADCLGCISLQTDSGAPTPQPRILRAPTAEDLIAVGSQHLARAAEFGQAGMVSFGQGCEGEPLLRERALGGVVEALRRRFPAATIHINTNGSRPRALQRLIAAGVNSCRISVFSFDQELFHAYYRPRGYTIGEVLESCSVAHRMGAQLTVNLLTFPGVTDLRDEMEGTITTLGGLEVDQLQLRSLNVDPLWLLERLPELPPGQGLAHFVELLRARLPQLSLGNFTRPLQPTS